MVAGYEPQFHCRCCRMDYPLRLQYAAHLCMYCFYQPEEFQEPEVQLDIVSEYIGPKGSKDWTPVDWRKEGF